MTTSPSRQIPDLLSRIFQLTKILEFFTLTIKKRKCIEMKSLPYIVIVYMLAQSSCTPKLLKEYAGSPRTFYEKDTAELKLDIDSVKQYSRVLSFFGVKNNEKYCIFIDNEKCGQNFNKSRFYGIVSAVRRVHLSPIVSIIWFS